MAAGYVIQAWEAGEGVLKVCDEVVILWVSPGQVLLAKDGK